jgi:UBX domain-containing protein 1
MSKKIATLGDMNNDHHSDEDDHEQKQTYFTGGDRSGQLVEGPDRPASIVDRIFNQAMNDTAQPPPAQPPPRQNLFSGSGYRLGSDDVPSTIIPPTQSQIPNHLIPPKVTRRMTFWRNGFTVDDGTLFLYDDPANRELLSSISRGQAPMAVLNVLPGQEVEVAIERKMDQDYLPPKEAQPKFSGAGHRLGAVLPTASTSAPPQRTPTSFSLDNALPVTTIQIRLSDGTRMVSKFNHAHTVGDVMGFVRASRPNTPAFVLSTTFPTRNLTDHAQTVQEAGILGAVVVQKLL